MIVLILGKPGSGKGTQAKLLAEELNLFYLSTGDISRKLAKKDVRIRKIVSSGGLIPEKEMTAHVSDFLSEKLKETRDILLDGYPRYVSQYDFLQNFLRNKDLRLDSVILLDVDDEEVVQRLSSRRMDKTTGKIYNLKTSPKPDSSVDPNNLIQRDDDTPEVIKKRIEEFKKNTLPMIDQAQEEGVLFKVDGKREIEAIQKDLIEHLEKIKNEK